MASPLLTDRRLPLWLGLLVAAAGVAAATGVVFALDAAAPVVALGVVYLPVVLLVSITWGAALGLATSLASALAFNFFHLPPTGRLTIAASGNWVALAAFAVCALSVSAVADAARRRDTEALARAAEADLAAELARGMLAGGEIDALLARSARRVADALGVSAARLARGTAEAGPREEAFALCDGDDTQVATLVVAAGLQGALRARLTERVLPSLQALVAAVLARDALLGEVVETAALRRSDDLKTAILRAVSHDLRSPLTSIVASGHALGARHLEPGEREQLAAGVVAESERLAHVIANLLDLSRLQAGAAPPHADWISVEEVLHAAGGGLEGDVRFAIDRDLPLVRADAAQLERAFANLIDNALRHGGNRAVSVRARAVRERLVVRVVDQGTGIAAADQPRIFEPFYRRGDGEGSGLGLAIVRGFVDANGGLVSVESLPGQGTSFVVELPLVTPAPPPATGEAAP